MSDQALSVVPTPEPKAPTTGFRGPVLWRTVSGVEGTAFEGFVAEIRSNLSEAEREALEQNLTRFDAQNMMAGWIKSWNYEVAVEVEVTLPAETVINSDGSETSLPERTVTRAEYVPLAPPAEAGPRVLDKVDTETFQQLRIHLCGGPVRLLRGKGAGAAADAGAAPSPDPEAATSNDADPVDQDAAPTPTKKTRAPRTPKKR